MSKVLDVELSNKFAADLNNANLTHEGDSVDDREDPGTLKEAFIQACEETSFQGIPFVVAPTPFPLRRFLWFLLVIGAAIQITYQVYERIAYYAEYPSNVNVEVNFNNSLAFPSIVICNQNDFRKTKAHEEGLYDLIDAMFLRPKEFLNDPKYDKQRESMTVWDLHNKLHHNKSDIIYSCQYAGKKCSPEVFKLIYTDYGVCFNYNGEPLTELYVNDVGSDVGLKLGINLEQYEYMSGSSESAGIKVLIFEKDEEAFVKNLGITVPPGAHALVGIELMEILNLKEPHGFCTDEWSYQYYPQKDYSRTRCKRDKRTKYISDECGCQDYFMPNEDIKYCSLSQHLDCLDKAEENFTDFTKVDCSDLSKEKMLGQNCKCPVPCRDMVYNPTISYSSLSRQKLYKLLQDDKIDEIKEKFNYAQEVHQRVTASVRETDKSVFGNLLNATSKMRQLLFGEIPQKFGEAVESMDRLNRTVTQAKENHDHTFEMMKYILRWKFYRYYEVFSGRYFEPLTESFYATAGSIKRILIQLNSTSDETFKKSLKFQLNDIVFNHEFLLENTNISVTETIEQYKNLAYKWITDNRSPEVKACWALNGIVNKTLQKTTAALDCLKGDEAAVPKEYLADQPLFQLHIDKFYGRVEEFNIKVLTKVKELIEVEENAGNISLEEVETLHKDWIYYSKRLIFHRAEFNDLHFYRPLELLDADWTQNFLTKYNRLANKMKDVKTEIDGMTSYLFTLQNRSWVVMEEIASKAEEFLVNTSMTKRDLADLVTSEKTEEKVKQIKLFLVEIRSRAHLLDDKIVPFGQSLDDFWKEILTNANARPYHIWRNYTGFQEDFAEKEKQNLKTMNELSNDIGVDKLINTRDEVFRESFNIFEKSLSDFKKSNEINEDFVKDNFLFVDFFFRELSYQRIEQQEAYDFFALLSDIGGAMGLLVGATFVSLLECCDNFINYYFLRRRYQRRKYDAT